MEPINDIVVFGLGAAGANLLLNLVRDLPEINYTAVDFDKVEERNFMAGTQPYTKENLNQYKTQAMSMILMKQGLKKVNFINKKIINKSCIDDVMTNLSNRVLFIDAFDKAEARNLLHQYWIDLYVEEILHIGFSPIMTGSAVWGDNWSGTSDYTGEWADTDICTERGARSFIMSLTSMTGLMIINALTRDRQFNFYVDSYLNVKRWK